MSRKGSLPRQGKSRSTGCGPASRLCALWPALLPAWLTASLPAWLAASLLLGGLLPGVATAQSLQPIPPLQARVTDLTGTLEPQQVQSLEAMLAALEQKKGAQVAVLMVQTTQPEAIEQYGIRVADAWKLGRGKARAEQASGDKNAAPVDDGVLLLIAKQDRRLRIEVGYGLEGAIPDGIAKRIIDESISPHFRRQDYFGGIQAGLQDLQTRIEGEDLPPAWQPANGATQQDEGVFGFLPVLVFAFVAGTILSSIIGRFLGAGASGLGAGFLGAAAVGSIPLAIGAGLVIFVLVLLMAPSASGLRRAGRNTYRNGPVILPGGWGGRGSGGGGFGGGGFGGGGGGFGGGGASGGW